MPQRDSALPNFGDVVPQVLQATAGTAGVRNTASGQSAPDVVGNAFLNAFGSIAQTAMAIQEQRDSAARDEAYLAGRTDQLTGDIQEGKYGTFTAGAYHAGQSMAIATAAASDYSANAHADMAGSIAAGEPPEQYVQRLQQRQADLLRGLDKANVHLRPEDHSRMLSTVGSLTESLGGTYSKQWDKHVIQVQDAALSQYSKLGGDQIIAALGSETPGQPLKNTPAALNEYMQTLVQMSPQSSMETRSAALINGLKRAVSVGAANGQNSYELAQSLGSAMLDHPAMGKFPPQVQAYVAATHKKMVQEYVELDMGKYHRNLTDMESQATRGQVPSDAAMQKNIGEVQRMFQAGVLPVEKYNQYYDRFMNMQDRAYKQVHGDNLPPELRSVEKVVDDLNKTIAAQAATGVSPLDAKIAVAGEVLIQANQSGLGNYSEGAARLLRPELQTFMGAKASELPKGKDGEPMVPAHWQTMVKYLSGLWNAPDGRSRYYSLTSVLTETDQKILTDTLGRYPANEASWAGLAMEITRTKEDVMLGNKSVTPYPVFTEATKQEGGTGFWAGLGSGILNIGSTIERLAGAPQAYAAIVGTEHLSDRQVLEAARHYPLAAGLRDSLLNGPSAQATNALTAAQDDAAQRERLYLGPAVSRALSAGEVKGKVEQRVYDRSIRTGAGLIMIPSGNSAADELHRAVPEAKEGLLDKYMADILKQNPNSTLKGAVLRPAGADGFVVDVYTANGGAVPLSSKLLTAAAVRADVGAYEEKYQVGSKNRNMSTTLSIPDMTPGRAVQGKVPSTSVVLTGENSLNVRGGLYIGLQQSTVLNEGYSAAVYKDNGPRKLDTVGFGFANHAPGKPSAFTDATTIPEAQRTPQAMLGVFHKWAPEYYNLYAAPNLKALGLSPGKSDSTTETATKLFFTAGYHSGSKAAEFTNIIGDAVQGGPSTYGAAMLRVQRTAAYTYASAARKREYLQDTMLVIHGLARQ